MQHQKTGFSTNKQPGSPMMRRRTLAGGREQLPREEKVYREIMGTDGKVKHQFEHWLVDLGIDSEDLLDKKLEDFKKEGETRVPKEILQTRYDFHHNKRFYKLGELWAIREKHREIEQQKVIQRQLKEKEKRVQKADSAREGNDTASRMPSQNGIKRPSRNNLKGPSNQNVTNDYVNMLQKGGANNLPNLGRKDSGTRVHSQSRIRGNSRMDARQTPRHSSMNVRDSVPNSHTRNTSQNRAGGGFFMTQPADMGQNSVSGPAPRSGAQNHRPGKMGPLLTPGHQRMISLNASQAFPAQMGSPEIQMTAYDIDREKNKIARFISNKERQGQVLAKRETEIADSFRKMELRQRSFEKRKRLERKQLLERLHEKQEEWQSKRDKVEETRKQLEDKSVAEYRRAVAQSKRRMKKELDGEEVMKTKKLAREELKAKSIQRETINSTQQQEDKNNRIETLRTLDSVEAKVVQHKTNAQIERMKIVETQREKIERARYQSMKHREELERDEMERQNDLFERLQKREKAVAKYEKEKKKASYAIREKNGEKQNMTFQCEQKRIEDVKQMARQQRQKEAKVRKKLEEAEQERKTQIDVKKEHFKLVQEDARKRIDIQKRNETFRKQLVLEKHIRIDEVCTQLNQHKSSFIEHSRLANEVRVQKLSVMTSPNKSKAQSPSKGAPGKDGSTLLA